MPRESLERCTAKHSKNSKIIPEIPAFEVVRKRTAPRFTMARKRLQIHRATVLPISFMLYTRKQRADNALYAFVSKELTTLYTRKQRADNALYA